MSRLRPFFSYYGSKYNHRSRPPKFPLIIEPFAGSACYSTKYASRNVILNDINPVICGIWDYLINVSEEEILDLPGYVEHIDDVKSCQEAKDLIGMNLGSGTDRIRNKPTSHAYWGPNKKRLIANQLHRIRHWKIQCGDYTTCPDVKATWFIDPPYSTPAGRYYKFNKIDFDALKKWVESRQGQIEVCDQAVATWLPFRKIQEGVTCGNGKRSEEAVYVKGTGFFDLFNK